MLSSFARTVRQTCVSVWVERTFGVAQATSVEQRGLRLAEETIEAAQAVGCDPAQIHALVDYVYARPKGELKQELGGIGVCILALAAAAGLDADTCEMDEVQRVLSKPAEHFSKRNDEKIEAGFIARGL